MADLLAKQDKKSYKVYRNQELEGEIVAITDSEIILDLGTKAEGVLPKKDLTPEQVANLKVGDKLVTFVTLPETESGQVLLTLQRVANIKGGSNQAKWQKFIDAMKNNQVLTGRGLEVNKGGLIVEVAGIRGFLPSSQVALSAASDIEKLVDHDISISVIEVDPSQNRLIFTQKIALSPEAKEKLSKLQAGGKVTGKVAAVLPFGVFVSIETPEFTGLEGLVHSSELSWEKDTDPGQDFKAGQEIEAKVVSIESDTGRVNLSVKQLSEDPFSETAKKYHTDDVIKATVSKISNQGIFFTLDDNLEGFMPQNKAEGGADYKEGESVTLLVDSVDSNRRRILLAPMLTTTKGLIYK